ncbi:hypothetical protein CCL15_24195 [Pseudomonas syringae]|nr:hypothetical protein CCL15_24195 [Pseudomonas syringae]
MFRFIHAGVVGRSRSLLVLAWAFFPVFFLASSLFVSRAGLFAGVVLGLVCLLEVVAVGWLLLDLVVCLWLYLQGFFLCFLRAGLVRWVGGTFVRWVCV